MEGIKGLVRGFATTFKILFRRPVTEQYPEYKRPLPARSRAGSSSPGTRTGMSGVLPVISARPSVR